VEQSPTTAPDGFHYVGESARFYKGKITKSLRKNPTTLESREKLYQDLYCAVVESKNGKDVVFYHCAILGCKCVVHMYVKPCGTVVFSNFFQHIEKNHNEYLFMADRNIFEKVALGVDSFFIPTASQTAPLIQGTSSSSTPSQADVRFKTSSDAKQSEKICAAEEDADDAEEGELERLADENAAWEAFLGEI
jgi:hypothetical protein